MKTPVKVALGCLGALLLLFVAGLVRDYYRKPEPTGVRPPPVVAKPMKTVASAPKRVVERKLVVPELPPKAVERVEQRFSLDLSAEELLTHVEIPKAPYGGEAAVTLPATGEPQVTFVANPRPFFDLGGEWAIAGGPVLHHDGELAVRLRVAKDLARVGPVFIRVEGAVTGARHNSELDVAVLGEARFR